MFSDLLAQGIEAVDNPVNIAGEIHKSAQRIGENPVFLEAQRIAEPFGGHICISGIYPAKLRTYFKSRLSKNCYKI